MRRVVELNFVVWFDIKFDKEMNYNLSLTIVIYFMDI